MEGENKLKNDLTRTDEQQLLNHNPGLMRAISLNHQSAQHVNEALAGDVAPRRDEVLAPGDGEPLVLPVGEAAEGVVAYPHG